MVDLKDLVALNVGRIRRQKGLTREVLAEQAGLSARYIGQIERAQASMTISVLGRIAAALAVKPAILVSDGRQAASHDARD